MFYSRKAIFFTCSTSIFKKTDQLWVCYSNHYFTRENRIVQFKTQSESQSSIAEQVCTIYQRPRIYISNITSKCHKTLYCFWLCNVTCKIYFSNIQNVIVHKYIFLFILLHYT